MGNSSSQDFDKYDYNYFFGKEFKGTKFRDMSIVEAKDLMFRSGYYNVIVVDENNPISISSEIKRRTVILTIDSRTKSKLVKTPYCIP